VIEGRGGLLEVRVTSPHATGEMYLHGGQVTSWKPAGADEVLFVSDRAHWQDGRAIRGGVPVCFPWFGPRAQQAGAPAHGFVRTKAWRLDSVVEIDGDVTVSMSTESTDDTRRWWPADFRLVHRVTFGATLVMALEVTNTGAAPLRFEEAAHTYYRVADIGAVRIGGLRGTRYLDAIDSAREKTQEGDIAIVSETDRIYVNNGGTIDIYDPASHRQIRVATEQARTAVVWNPWIAKARALPDLGDDEWKRFVCVESSNVSPAAVDLAPGQPHRMRVVVTVDDL
jgi:glucose-6-phosphate 1-epimerase